MKRNCRGVPPAIVDYFRSLKPYGGGDDRLFGLNSANNTNKHWEITPISVGAPAVTILFPDRTRKMIELTDMPQGNETAFEMFASENGSMDYMLEIITTMRFRDAPGLEGAFPETILNSLHKQVSAIVDNTEEICRDIGIL